MAETTQPDAAVGSLNEASVIGALESQFSDPPKQEPKAAPQEAAQESDAQAQPDDLTDADLPEEGDGEQQAAPPSEDVFEIVHNGQQVKLSREDAIRYARQGFDYDRKTQAVAETQRNFQAALQRIAEIEQVQPQIAQHAGVVQSLAQQLQSQKYSDQELIRLAQADPLEYPMRAAERDLLRNHLSQAYGQYQQLTQTVAQQRDQMTQWQLQQEAARLPEIIPAWRDSAKMESDRQEMTKYVQSLGVDMANVGRYLDNAVAMKVLRQSMLYERLSKLKADKSKQLRNAPPVVKPGTTRTDKGRPDREALTAIRKAGKQGNHSAQEKLVTGLLGKAFPL